METHIHVNIINKAHCHSELVLLSIRLHAIDMYASKEVYKQCLSGRLVDIAMRTITEGISTGWSQQYIHLHIHARPELNIAHSLTSSSQGYPYRTSCNKREQV